MGQAVGGGRLGRICILMHTVRGPLSVWQIQMQAAQLMGGGGSGSGREEVGAQIARDFES